MIKGDDTPLFYGGEELQAFKLSKVQSALKAGDLDALLLLKHDAVRYVTGFYAKGYRPFVEFEYAALVMAEGGVVLGTAIPGEVSRARLRSRAQDVRQLPHIREWSKVLAAIMGDHHLEKSRVGFDLLPQFIYRGLREALPDLDLVEASDIWSQVTAVKHRLEIELLRHALHIVQRGIGVALSELRPGKTEIEISAIAEFEMRRMGSEMNPFIPIVASGENAALGERLASDRVIGASDMVVLDFGCVYKGYTGDIARTAVLGEPSLAQRRLYRVVHQALQEAIASVRPGIPCGAIDALVRRVIQEAGLERYSPPWAVGHQLGYGLHGSPLLGPGVEDPLQVGMVINIEPALNVPDDLTLGGVQLEDTVLVTPDGCQRLTQFPYEAKLLA